MDKQRVLITVKTYPTLSRKYGETVCTARPLPHECMDKSTPP